MLIELLSSSQQITFNSKVANIIGLHAAIYLSELISINEKAIRKGKIDEKAFTLDREYIKNRTTLSEKEQLELDKTLTDLGIIKAHNNILEIDLSTLTSIMSCEDDKLVKDISNLSKPKKTAKQKKIEVQKSDAKCCVNVTNPEIRDLYYQWIDVIFEKSEFLPKQAVILGQQVVNDFAPNDDVMQQKILNNAIINSYRDLSWAVNNIKRENPYYQPSKVTAATSKSSMIKNPNFISKPKRLSEEIF